MTPTPNSRDRLLILAAFACVYIFWGSTFVGIRYAVAYISPAFVSGMRYTAAGLIMLAIFIARRKSIFVSRRELGRLTLIGLLMLTGNNVLLALGEKYVTAGFASLVMAGIPLFIALLETVIPGGEPLSPLGWLGTLLGLGGLVILLWPALHAAGINLHTGAHEVSPAFGPIILLIGGVSWAIGSVISRRKPSTADPFLASAWQMVIAGTINILIGAATGGWKTSHFTPGIYLTLAYLATFGSLVGYSAYTYLLHHVSIAKVATYAYVNPIVAVLLGAVFLGEHLHGIEWLGMAIILAAVAIVTTTKSVAAKKALPQKDLSETPIAETTAERT